MNINRDNYEMYFLDYLEGRLTTDETAALLLFADENPDLKELLEGEELITLTPDEQIGFFPKSALKKKTVSDPENEDTVSGDHSVSGDVPRISIHDGNREEFMIRYYENELDENEKAELAAFLKDSPTYIKEFELFGNTLLKADQNIIYPHKNSLKRRLILQPPYRRIVTVVSVAASVLLFSTLFLKFIIQPDLKHPNNQLAGTNNPNTEKSNPVKAKTNIAAVNPAEVMAKNKASKSELTAPVKGQPQVNKVVIRQGFEPMTPTRTQKVTQRTNLELPASLVSKQAPLLAYGGINAPSAIDRRTDFDGITSAAYYDPDPDEFPAKTEGRNIGGRIGQTLASGISQTAGTIAREPELGRLLRGKISLSDIASIGIAGFNLITDSKLAVSRRYDDAGNPKGYTIVDENKRIKQ